MPRAAALFAASLLAAVVPSPAGAQQPTPGARRPPPRPAAAPGQRCVFQIDNVDRQGSVVETPEGTNYFAGGNVRLSCRGQQITMRSDSVAAYRGQVVQFIGGVQYRDSALAMDADFGTYHRAGERWEARGNVVTRNLRSGSTLRGPSLDYYREVRGVRDTIEMVAVGRPRIEYVTLDSAGRPSEPYVIVANRVRLRGNDLMWASGNVTIDRSDFAARGDSLRLDTGPRGDGTLLGRAPELRGLGPDNFRLAGRRIDFALEGRELKRVVARGSGHAVSRDWDLVADTIAVELVGRRLERTLAWGRGTRPFAFSPSYAMRADSLALDTPGQVLREVRGFRRAWLGGAFDPVTRERDWMRGDTVFARFAARDSAGTRRAVLRQIEARHGAQSYQLERAAGQTGRPAVNYARGERITVTMQAPPGRDVDRVEVRGQVEGVRLEPVAAAPRDTARAAPADTLRRQSLR